MSLYDLRTQTPETQQEELTGPIVKGLRDKGGESLQMKPGRLPLETRQESLLIQGLGGTGGEMGLRQQRKNHFFFLCRVGGVSSRCFENEAGTQLEEIYFGVNFFQIYQSPPVFFLYVNLK